MLVRYNRIQKIDDWLSKSVEVSAETEVDHLGFRQLNDLLLLKYFPHLADKDIGPLGIKLLEYKSVMRADVISDITFGTYKRAVSATLSCLPSADQIKQYTKHEIEVLGLNLSYIVFTIERWGQHLHSCRAGETSEKLLLNHLNNTSILDYLKSISPDFNSLENFALRFVDEVDKFEFPESKKLGITSSYEFRSPYRKSSYTRNKSRYPSAEKLDSFHLLIKKSELLAQCYNDLALHLINSIVQGEDVASSTNLFTVRQIIKLIRYNQFLMIQFMKDRSFDEFKFAYILRQITVEVSRSPFDCVFEDYQLDQRKNFQVKGLVNHFLKKADFTSRERQIFKTDIVHTLKLIGNYPEEKKQQLLSELDQNDGIGIQRFLFTMFLVSIQRPELTRIVSELCASPDTVQSIVQQLNQNKYEYAPSGANSLAFFGLDTLLGVASSVPNYLSHMVNRLPVMTRFDNDAFWKFYELLDSGVHSVIEKAISDASLGNASNKTNCCLPGWSVHYLVLFDEISRLSSLHGGMVNRFLHRFTETMPSQDKREMTSSLKHGTTFMAPKRGLHKEDFISLLPSLKDLDSRRREHVLVVHNDRMTVSRSSVDLARTLREIDVNRMSMFFS